MLRSADSVVENPPTRSDGQYLPSQSAVQRSAFLRCCVRYQRVRSPNQIIRYSVLIGLPSELYWRFILINCFV